MNKISKRYLGITIIMVSLVVVFCYWLYTIFYPSTDDAYITANQINVISQITGQVDQVYVNNNQEVKVGQILFMIDAKPFELAVEHAKLQLNIIKNEVNNLKSKLSAAQYDFQIQKAVKNQKNQYYQRALELYKQNFLSGVELDNAVAANKIAIANEAKAQVNVQQLQNELNNYFLQIAIQQNNLNKVIFDLKHTKIQSTLNGKVVDFNLRPGQIVNTSQPLFSIIEHNKWISANFKETQLNRVHVGQKVKIEIDMFSSKSYDGIISSISPASGSALSVLPPENFSGNWVKITQRIPVKINFIDKSIVYEIPVGASATVTVNTL